MATGYFPYLLRDISTYAGMATPHSKIDAHGLTAMTLANAAANPIELQETPGDGTNREVRVKYRQRNTKAQTDTSASCDNVLTNPRLEATISINNTRAIAWYLSDATLALYEKESHTNTGGPGNLSGISRELMEIMFSGANGILKAMNDDLWGLVSYGKNIGESPAVSTAVTLNLPQAVGTQPLTSGMPKLLYDFQRNGFQGRPQVVGSGLFHSYILTQPYKALDSYGMNSAIATAALDFWPDMDLSDNTSNANSIVMFEPGSIQLVEKLEYTGAFGGVKPGASEFGVIPIPVNVNGRLASVKFDAQLKYFDCPTTLTDMYTGNSSTYPKGWSLMIKKDFALWQTPSDAYRHEDPKRSVNGALRYTVTNS